MAGEVRFRLSRKALRDIAFSDEVMVELFKRAERIRDACDPTNRFGDDGYVVAVGKGRTRTRVAVIAVHPHARNSNAIHNTLVNNLDAGRG
jgi:hypothetical protein